MRKKKTPIAISLLFLLAILITLSLLFRLRHTRNNNQKNALFYHFKAIAAYQKKDYSAFLDNLKTAIKHAPNHPEFMYNLARAFALNNNKRDAIYWLGRSVAMKFYIDLDDLDDFDSLKDLEEFKAILRKHDKMKFPVNNSKIAFKIPEKDLIPEGITHDPVENIFYITSTYKSKIISINRKGIIKDFTTQKQDGLSNITGIKVDVKRRVLWVGCNPTFTIKKNKKIWFGSTGIFKYNLNNGKLIKKYLLGEGPGSHGFNDCCINSRGDVFITDGLFRAVYWISNEKDELELFVKPDHFTYPNGITLSKDEKYLYVSHIEGTSMINVNNKSFHNLSHPENMALTQIDGLYFYEKSLIAIQRDNWHDRVIQFFLNEDLNQVQSAKIIESGNPQFMFPTTGVIVDNKFYYIANSQMNFFTKDRTLFPKDKLRDVLIYKIRL